MEYISVVFPFQEYGTYSVQKIQKHAHMSKNAHVWAGLRGKHNFKVGWRKKKTLHQVGTSKRCILEFGPMSEKNCT
jgi:hypothetical protein